MTAPLSPSERRKLVAILGMMGSDHDGERAAAAALASRLVRDKGLTWDAVIPADGAGQSGRAGVGSAGGTGGADGGGWRSVLAFCQRHQRALSDWECQFLAGLRDRRAPPTLRQIAKLNQVADALRAQGLS